MSSTRMIPVLPNACTACGTALPHSAHFCPGCGRPVVPLKNTESSGSSSFPLAGGALPSQSQILNAIGPKETKIELPERYRIESMLGRGGMGVVYKCFDTALERPVAIKMMTERYHTDGLAQRRFLREARAQAIINHINVARILNVGLAPKNRLFIVMEFVDGKDLRQDIRDNPKGLVPERACFLATQACAGLSDAHAGKIIHRDLKPSNIMVVKDYQGKEQIKVLDLGLAKIAGGQTDLKTITADTASLLMGTPAYMSPEQVSGAGVDHRADIYALGVVLFEMLTGRLPFVSETVEGWLYQHLHVEAPAISRVKPELVRFPSLDQVVNSALAKSPDDRPQSMDQFAQEIEAALQEVIAMQNSDINGATVDIVFDSSWLPPKVSRPSSSSHIAPSAILNRSPVAQSGSAANANQSPNPEVLRNNRCVALTKEAEDAEQARQWDVAIEAWKQVLKYTANKVNIQIRIGAVQREIDFEHIVAESGTYAASGDWNRAAAALARASTLLPKDSRLITARARMPKRLICSWLDGARERLQSFAHGPARQNVLRKLAVLRARMGDMKGAVSVLREESGQPSSQAVGLAQAARASIGTGNREGMRPYLEKAFTLAEEVSDPQTKGRALLECGRAFSAYGDFEATANAFMKARESFLIAENQQKDMGFELESPSDEAQDPRKSIFARRRRRTTSLLKNRPSNRKEIVLSEIARLQAQSGLAAAAIETANLIKDAWSRSQTLARVVKELIHRGLNVEAEQFLNQITFSLLKAQALCAVAIGKVYQAQPVEAEKLLTQIGPAAARAPVFANLAAYHSQHPDLGGRSAYFIREAMNACYEISGSASRIEALMSCSQPLIEIGKAELADPLLTAAGRLIGNAEDPIERLQGYLQLARTRDKIQPDIALTMAPADPSMLLNSELHESLRQAVATMPLVTEQAERLRNLEALAAALSETGSHDLVPDLIKQIRSEAEHALVLVGLASGMI